MQKNVFQFLSSSSKANDFFEEIHNSHKCSKSTKVEDSIVLGKQKNASENDRIFIINSLNLDDDISINSFDSVLLHSKVYYETYNRKKIRTLDSFVLNVESKNFAEIKLIFVVENKLYFYIIERFEIVECQNSCDSIIYLKNKTVPLYKIVESKLIGPKFALVQFENVIACSQFPNMYERN